MKAKWRTRQRKQLLPNYMYNLTHQNRIWEGSALKNPAISLTPSHVHIDCPCKLEAGRSDLPPQDPLTVIKVSHNSSINVHILKKNGRREKRRGHLPAFPNRGSSLRDGLLSCLAILRLLRDKCMCMHARHLPCRSWRSQQLPMRFHIDWIP